MDSKSYDMRRERSQNKIFRSLEHEPKRFTDLEGETGLSPAGLTAILKFLKNEKKIESTLIDGKPKYTLTKKGKISLDDLFNLTHDIEEIRARGGKHYRDYSTLWGSTISCGLPWGIESDLTLDKELNKLNLLTPKDVIAIEESVFEKFSKNIKKRKLTEEQVGNIVLGFRIDYSNLVKSIKENSLTYMNHISKEECKLREKMGDYPERVTKKEWERLKELRKKTYEKIKKLPKSEK